jgi:hypothetical protein
MKKIFLLFISSIVFVFAVDPSLKAYQERYSLCHGKTDYQIADCLLNGNLNFASFRGDRSVFKG